MNSDRSPSPLPAFHGTAREAVYREQIVGRYQGNPLIESLDGILSIEEAALRLSHYPNIDHNVQKLPPEIRQHLAMDTLRFRVPLPVHLDLEQRISRILRDGYVDRNPLDRNHWREIDDKVETIMKAGNAPPRSACPSGFAIIGCPGAGKSTGTEGVLQLYPQVILHKTYKGNPFHRTQIVWLKLTCPYDGSIKGLCLNFFSEIDGLLGTTYSRDYAGGGRRTVDELIPAMARVAWIHCLGVLAIDEIQHLSQASSGGAERMLNFFLQLMNTLGLPVVLIGTYAALEILSRELRQIRRNSGQGDLVWDRMQNDEVWRHFVESLWRYQYTTSPVPLSQELCDTLYDECVGIVDFAVKLFLLAQVRAITTGTERITPALISSVAKDSLRMAQPVLQAIRKGDMRAVASMSDLNPIDFQSAAQQMRKADILKSLSTGTRLASEINAAPSLPSAPDPGDVPGSINPEANPDHPVPLEPFGPTTKVRRSKIKNETSKCQLVQVAQTGFKKGLSAHDALVQAGFIKPLFQSQTTGNVAA